jgi:hypothetical protein
LSHQTRMEEGMSWVAMYGGEILRLISARERLKSSFGWV